MPNLKVANDYPNSVLAGDLQAPGEIRDADLGGRVVIFRTGRSVQLVMKTPSRLAAMRARGIEVRSVRSCSQPMRFTSRSGRANWITASTLPSRVTGRE